MPRARSSRFSVLVPDLMTVVSAVLIVLSFPPWGYYPLIWFSLVPWMLAMKRADSPRAAFVQGIWLSFFMSLFGFFWVGYVLHAFAELSWPLAVIGLLLYGLIGQPQFYVFAPLWKWLEPRIRNPFVATLCFALLYTGVDWLVPKLFVDTLGHCLWRATRLRQAADIGGAALLTFFIYLVNDAAWRAWNQRRELKASLRRWAPQAVTAVLLSATFLTYGQLRRDQVRRIVARSHRFLQAGVIQANIGDFDKVAAETGVREAADRILSTFFRLSDDALALKPRPDVLIWPETSYPSTFRTPDSVDDLRRDGTVDHFVKTRNATLAFGGYDHQGTKDYNAFFFLSPRRENDPAEFRPPGDLQVYRKNVLLLFGEYIPGAETFTFLQTAFPQVGNFGRGRGPRVLRIVNADPAVPDVLVGPIICYEALFPNYVIKAARLGSQMILNITNDSWFGPWGEPILHFSLVTFRSIETRLPQLRATNTGISALILPDGTVAQRSDIDKPEVMNLRVPLTPPIPTLMKKWGDWFGPFSLAAGLLLAALAAFSRKGLLGRRPTAV